MFNLPIDILAQICYYIIVRRGKPIKNITVDEVQTGIRVSEGNKTNSPDSLDSTPQHSMERGNAFPEALAEKADGLTPPLQ